MIIALGVCLSDKIIPLQNDAVSVFLCLFKVWSMLQHRPNELVRIKNAFLAFFVLFHHKICVFIIFISFFDEVSNFHNRLPTNQKQEMVVQNCQ